MSNDDYQQQKDWIHIGKGIEGQIKDGPILPNLIGYNLTEQDIIDLIRALTDPPEGIYFKQTNHLPEQFKDENKK